MIDQKRIAGILNSEPVDLRTENAELRAEVKRLTAELAAIREAEQERKAFAAHVFDMLGKSTNPHPRPPVVLEDSDGF